MGNRAVITSKAKKIGIYVHWNGGLESVTGFCEACEELGFRNPNRDELYGFAYMAAAIVTFFGDGASCGVGELESLDCNNCDNGVYVIGDKWEIVERYGDGWENIVPLTEDQRKKADNIRNLIVRRWKAAQAIK